MRRILCEIADALAYAHLRGVIHRDIKPDNILLDHRTGRAMVTDFGIAWAMEAGARLTATGIAVGTPTYMSPEQAVGERALDGRSDIYSVGVLAYQMLTGRVPFEAGNSMALLLKHVSERPRAIGELRPDAPRALRDAIERAMAKAPEDRWPSAAALRDALSATDSLGPTWRADQRDPVRYTSPRPDGSRRVLALRSPRRGTPSVDADQSPLARADQRSRSDRAPARADVAELFPTREPRTPADMTFVPPHLAALTAEQRADLRLWHGRVTLRERVKAIRWYAWLTMGATVGGIAGFAFGVAEVPPFVVAPIIPMFMWRKLWRRGKSLRETGLKLREILPRMHFVLRPPSIERQMEKLAPRAVLDGPDGGAIRRAVEDRAAILQLFGKLSKADRARLPDLAVTVRMLVERVAHLAHTLHRLDGSIDPTLGPDLSARIADVERESGSPEGERRLALLRRQRGTLDELVDRRTALAQQLDSAGLALGNLRLDLVKVQSSGLESAFSDVSSATQEARALSSEIDAVLAAAAEVRGL